MLPGDSTALPLLQFDRLSYSIQAITEVSICVFSRKDLVDHLYADPRTIRHRDQIAKHEADAIDQRLVDLGARTGYERVASFVLARRGATEGTTFEFPLRRHHMAEALGLTAVHVGRVLRELRQDGLLLLQRGRLQILDLERLAKAAGLDDRAFRPAEAEASPAS